PPAEPWMGRQRCVAGNDGQQSTTSRPPSSIASCRASRSPRTAEPENNSVGEMPCTRKTRSRIPPPPCPAPTSLVAGAAVVPAADGATPPRSEEHTSELQSRENLVCR